ncbi:hypothetical protein QFZ49_004702 [Streptomyces turgidiscabies]|uniref:Uncharacterized protein n=1 Tax=Streptomyces turgidiscabies TaxID=85558 RepID=A0ABU0RRZ4_9ACTN|nr:hypothetical protein [Streptomyces turgidiscabies]
MEGSEFHLAQGLRDFGDLGRAAQWRCLGELHLVLRGLLDTGDGRGQPVPGHVMGGLGERTEGAGEGTGGEGGEAGHEGGDEGSRQDVGGEGQFGVTTEVVRPVPYVVADRLLDGVEVVHEYGHRVPPGAGVCAQRGAVGGDFGAALVGGGSGGGPGGERVLQGGELGRGGDLPEAGQGGDAGGTHLGEGEVLAAVEDALGEHAVEEAAFEGDRLLGRRQFPQRRQSIAQLTVVARHGVRHRVDGVEGVDGGGVENEGGGAVGGALSPGLPVGSGADGVEAAQVPLDDALDVALGAHRAQRRVDALAGGGECRAVFLLTAQQAVRQAAFALQLVHQRLDAQTEADLGAGRARVTEGLRAAVHGQAGHRQQQTDRDGDDHRHPAPDTAPAGQRTAAGSRGAGVVTHCETPGPPPPDNAFADRAGSAEPGKQPP